MYMYTHPYTYIHLCIEAEGALEGRSSQTCTLAQPRAKAAVYVYMYTYQFIYIYIYIHIYTHANSSRKSSTKALIPDVYYDVALR